MKWLILLILVKAVFGADQNPDENRGIDDPNLFEGDMILDPIQRYRVEHGMDVDIGDDRKRGSIRGRGLWRDGVVVYQIDSRLATSSRAMDAIQAGMREWTEKTCIRFKERRREASYVKFVFGNGCASSIGRTGRLQTIKLGPTCWFKGLVAHEIAHAVGFYHEQSRPDRDKFIKIQWKNIKKNRRRDFLKYRRSKIDSLGSPYDFRSLMHYGRKAFNKNGGVTIKVKQAGVKIGQRKGLSATDAQQANLLYKSQCRKGRPRRRPRGRPRRRPRGRRRQIRRPRGRGGPRTRPRAG